MLAKMSSITVGHAAHSTEDAKYVVIDSKHVEHGVPRVVEGRVHLVISVANRVLGLVDKFSIINTRHICSASWLMLLRLERETVNVDAVCWCAAVVLVGLHLVEVHTFADVEPIVTIELDIARVNNVALTVQEHAIVVWGNNRNIIAFIAFEAAIDCAAETRDWNRQVSQRQ